MSVNSGSFFKTMLGTKASREILVSRAFAACFSESPVFRAVVLTSISAKCRLNPKKVLASVWACECEIPVSNGRLDLRLTPSGSLQRIVLENKVGAQLTRNQIRRYRRSQKGDILIAITKRHPEVGRRWLESKDCVSMRWQDIHDALGRVTGTKHKNAFLCLAFRQYLEELGMAHRGKVTRRDVARVARLLKAARADVRHVEIDPAPAFNAGLSILGLLDEVLVECREMAPKLDDWSVWGPSYFKWRENGKHFHHFAFRLKRDGWKSAAGAGLEIPSEGGKLKWITAYKKSSRHDWEDRQHYLSDVVDRAGAFNVDAMARIFVTDLRKVGMLPKKS